LATATSIAGSGVRSFVVVNDKCPFCDLVFERDDRYEKYGLVSPIERHIMEDHRKVRVSNGNGERWVDEA
jgi:hypothetical protein